MRERIAALRNAFKMTREVDPRLVPYLLTGVGLTLLVAIGVGVWSGRPILWSVIAVLAALSVGMTIFGRRAQKAQYAMIEGHVGAAAAVLQSMRGQWFVTPAIAVTRRQELVHRVVGRPGIILVAEGESTARLKQLLAQERKRVARVAGDVPIHTVIVGDRDGEVALSRLQWHLTRLGAKLSKREVPKLHRKLAPLDKGNIPIPKGYIPRPGKKQR